MEIGNTPSDLRRCQTLHRRHIARDTLKPREDVAMIVGDMDFEGLARFHPGYHCICSCAEIYWNAEKDLAVYFQYGPIHLCYYRWRDLRPEIWWFSTKTICECACCFCVLHEELKTWNLRQYCLTEIQIVRDLMKTNFFEVMVTVNL